MVCQFDFPYVEQSGHAGMLITSCRSMLTGRPTSEAMFLFRIEVKSKNEPCFAANSEESFATSEYERLGSINRRR